MAILNINKLAFGGAGFGHIDGKACFVPYTAPGDTAEIELISDKKSYSIGRLIELKSFSTLRQPPACPFFADCGGCSWQHIDYEAQCRWKDEIFTETMWRIARIEADRVSSIQSAQEVFFYRQRVQLKIHYANGRLSIGFFRSGTHYVVDIMGRCLIASRFLNSAIPEIRTIINASPEPDRIPQVDLAAGEDGSIAALFHYIGSSPDKFSRYLQLHDSRLSAITSIFMQSGRKNSFRCIFGNEMLKYSLPDMRGRTVELKYSVDTFSQINFSQNRSLLHHLQGVVTKIAPKKVLDIYCGNGNFSLPIASESVAVVGIEASEKSVAIARDNAKGAGVANATFHSGDAVKHFDSLSAAREKFDLLILDPPRVGAQEIVKKISQIDPSNIIYISCDPVTLARDLATLKKSGFRVNSIQPVDMFPQTYHIESITWLERI